MQQNNAFLKGHIAVVVVHFIFSSYTSPYSLYTLNQAQWGPRNERASQKCSHSETLLETSLFPLHFL